MVFCRLQFSPLIFSLYFISILEEGFPYSNHPILQENPLNHDFTSLLVLRFLFCSAENFLTSGQSFSLSAL